MKTVLAFITILLCTTTQAQETHWLFGLGTKDSCRMLANDIIKKFKGNYHLAAEKENEKGAKFFAMVFKCDSIQKAGNEFYQVSVVFARYDAGVAPKYFLKGLKGSFAETFAMWQKYIDADADEAKIQRGRAVRKTITLNGRSLACMFLQLSTSRDTWEIMII